MLSASNTAFVLPLKFCYIFSVLHFFRSIKILSEFFNANSTFEMGKPQKVSKQQEQPKDAACHFHIKSS
jgi:hypothetical protein